MGKAGTCRTVPVSAGLGIDVLTNGEDDPPQAGDMEYLYLSPDIPQIFPVHFPFRVRVRERELLLLYA